MLGKEWNVFFFFQKKTNKHFPVVICCGVFKNGNGFEAVTPNKCSRRTLEHVVTRSRFGIVLFIFTFSHLENELIFMLLISHPARRPVLVYHL